MNTFDKISLCSHLYDCMIMTSKILNSFKSIDIQT